MYENYYPNIVAVSKTFKIEHINHLIEFGHKHFGENKVQETIEKWTEIKKRDSSIKLHMLGKLQTNKVKLAVRIFDYIHSVDSLKLAKKISEEQKKYNKQLSLFLQVNIGNEAQKSGINKSDDKRIGFVVQSYIGTNVKQVLGKNSVQLARGVDKFNYHEKIGRPQKLLDENDIKLKKKENDNLQEIFYKGSDKKGKF